MADHEPEMLISPTGAWVEVRDPVAANNLEFGAGYRRPTDEELAEAAEAAAESTTTDPEPAAEQRAAAPAEPEKRATKATPPAGDKQQ